MATSDSATEISRQGRTAGDNKRAAIGGIVAGLIGGLALSVLLTITGAAQGQDIWVGYKGAAIPFLGAERVSRPGFEAGPVFLGLLSHFGISAFWGLLFGLIVYGLSRGATLAAGVLWGLVVWLGMYYAVLPMIGLGALARAVPVGSAVLGHVVFGLATAVGFLPFQRARHRIEPPGARRFPVTP